MPQIEYVTVANHAEAINGLLYLQGAGLTDVMQPMDGSGAPGVVHIGLGVSLLVGWNETNRTYPMQLHIEHEDGETVAIIDATVEAGRPAGLAPGSDQRHVLAISGEVQFAREGGYRVRAVIDGQERAVTFRVVRPATSGPVTRAGGPTDFDIPPL
jgi:hypothetical protein